VLVLEGAEDLVAAISDGKFALTGNAETGESSGPLGVPTNGALSELLAVAGSLEISVSSGRPIRIGVFTAKDGGELPGDPAEATMPACARPAELDAFTPARLRCATVADGLGAAPAAKSGVDADGVAGPASCTTAEAELGMPNRLNIRGRSSGTAGEFGAAR
jgi:hypothetical protein